MAESNCCECSCHSRADRSRLIIPPALDNPVETAVACSQCRWRHYPPEPPHNFGSADGWTNDDTTDTD